MEQWKDESGLIAETITILEAKEKRDKAKVKWEEVVQKGKELREKELLDMCDQVIEGDNDKARKARKKQATKLKKAEYRKWSLRYLTDAVGKGPKTPLKIVKVMKEDGSIVEVKYEREEIKESLIN